MFAMYIGSRKTNLSSSRVEEIMQRMLRFTVEVPSWGFANTGTFNLGLKAGKN